MIISIIVTHNSDGITIWLNVIMSSSFLILERVEPMLLDFTNFNNKLLFVVNIATNITNTMISIIPG